MSNDCRVVPCKSCPFRKDVPAFLPEAARSLLARGAQSGAFAPCHNTTDYGLDGSPIVRARSRHCAGALIFAGHEPPDERIYPSVAAMIAAPHQPNTGPWVERIDGSRQRIGFASVVDIP